MTTVSPTLTRMLRRLLAPALLLAAAGAQAAIVTLTPTVSAVLNGDFSTVDASSIVGDHLLAARPGSFYLLQIDVQVTTTGLGGSAVGFASTGFNSAILGTGASLYFDLGLGVNAWTPDNPSFDMNGPAPGGQVSTWEENVDANVANDLQEVMLAGITSGFGPVQYDIRRTLTQGGGRNAGTFYVKLDGAGGSSAAAEIIAAFGASTYDANGASTEVGNTAVGGTTRYWHVARAQVVPEPSTLALCGMGGMLMAIARRRRR